ERDHRWQQVRGGLVVGSLLPPCVGRQPGLQQQEEILRPDLGTDQELDAIDCERADVGGGRHAPSATRDGTDVDEAGLGKRLGLGPCQLQVTRAVLRQDRHPRQLFESSAAASSAISSPASSLNRARTCGNRKYSILVASPKNWSS